MQAGGGSGGRSPSGLIHWYPGVKIPRVCLWYSVGWVEPQAPKAPAVLLPNPFPETPFSTVRIFMAERGSPRAAPNPLPSIPSLLPSSLFPPPLSLLLYPPPSPHLFVRGAWEVPKGP